MTKSIAVLLVLAAVLGCQAVPKPASLMCRAFCPQNLTYDNVEQVCTFGGATYTNSLCPYGVTFFSCTQTGPVSDPNMTANVVVQSAGSCACPSNCSSTYRGACQATGCQCAAGFSGADCSSVVCSSDQTCLNRGTCTNVNGFDVCQCAAGYSGFDCSAATPALPAIVPAFGAATPAQYTSQDEYGANNPLFNEQTIATIWLQVSDSDLQWMMNPLNAQTHDYRQAKFAFYNGNVSIAPVLVGLRIKGGASRNYMKKSWKISFDEYDADQSFYQQKKLLLKATSMTPDYVRERASRDLIYSMGAATQRMVYANLYINGAYRGLFVLMDNIDNTWLKSRFGSSAGGLWKCSLTQRMPTLLWQGPSCANYSTDEYQPENSFATANCSVLVQLIDVLNNAPDDQFESAIQQIFDVTYYLRTLVVEVLTGNWDGGSWDGNNYYLYYDLSTSPPLFKYIRQDLDMSIGCVGELSLVPSYDNALREGDIYKYGTTTYGRVLTSRILGTPSFRQVYASFMKQLMGSYYLLLDPQSAFVQRVTAMHRSVAPYVELDYWHRLDMGMNYADFNSNVADAAVARNLYLPNGTTYDYTFCYEMFPWAHDRYVSAQAQLQ